MKAAYIEQTGPASNLQWGDLPTPMPTGSQVRVKVGAVAVNPIDTYIRSGLVAMNLPTPYIVGCDLAGTVDAVGPQATGFKFGDRVWGSNQGLFGRQGTFAEYACVEEHWLYPTAAGVSDATAAAGALVGITAHLGIVQFARVQPGEVVFVNGGSGGVGSMVVQIAKAVGAKVVCTAGSAAKVAQCQALGADRVINYKTENVDQAVLAFAPMGVNVFWETLRQPDFDRMVSLTAKRGRLVLMAGREARPTFPVGPFYVKDLTLVGFAMFNATPVEQRSCAIDLNRWLASGQLKPPIGQRLKLAEAAAAHQLQEDNTLRQAGTLAGKIVLEP